MDDMDFHKEGTFPGLRYKLQDVSVCGNCLCIYTAIHAVVTLVRRQRRDLWAERELRRRREQEEDEEKREKEEWLTERIMRGDGSGFNIESFDRQRRSRSHYLEPELQDWLHGLDLDDASPAATKSARGGPGSCLSPKASPAGVGRMPSSRRQCAVGGVGRSGSSHFVGAGAAGGQRLGGTSPTVAGRSTAT